jgi:hypothetical protein
VYAAFLAFATQLITAETVGVAGLVGVLVELHCRWYYAYIYTYIVR